MFRYLDPTVVTQAVQLLQEGTSIRTIARRFGVSPMGIPMEGHTNLYRLDNGTLTAIGYRDETLGPTVRYYAGAVVLSSS